MPIRCMSLHNKLWRAGIGRPGDRTGATRLITFSVLKPQPGILGYVPNNAGIVKLDERTTFDAVGRQQGVRWSGLCHPGMKLDLLFTDGFELDPLYRCSP